MTQVKMLTIKSKDELRIDVAKYGSPTPMFDASKPIDLELQYEFSIPESDVSKKFEATFRTSWLKEKDKIKSDTEKTFKEIILDCEKRTIKTLAKLAKSKSTDVCTGGVYDIERAKIWMKDRREEANALIKQALLSLKTNIPKLMSDFAENFFEKYFKANKNVINMGKFHAVCNIGVWAGLGFYATVGGIIATAGGVVSAIGTYGAASPLAIMTIVFAAISTTAAVAGSGAKIHQIIKRNWPNHKKAGVALRDQLESLEKIIKRDEKIVQSREDDKVLEKTNIKNEIKYKYKLLKDGSTANKIKEINSSIAQMSKWNTELLGNIIESQKALHNLEARHMAAQEEIKKAMESKYDTNSPEGKKLSTNLEKKKKEFNTLTIEIRKSKECIDKMQKHLTQYDVLIKACKDTFEEANISKITQSGLMKLIVVISNFANSEVVEFGVEVIGTLYSNAANNLTAW